MIVSFIFSCHLEISRISLHKTNLTLDPSDLNEQHLFSIHGSFVAGWRGSEIGSIWSRDADTAPPTLKPSYEAAMLGVFPVTTARAVRDRHSSPDLERHHPEHILLVPSLSLFFFYFVTFWMTLFFSSLKVSPFFFIVLFLFLMPVSLFGGLLRMERRCCLLRQAPFLF